MTSAKDVYEVVIMPQDRELNKDMDIRVLAFAEEPSGALDKAKKYIFEGRKEFSNVVGPIDFFVHKRILLE